MTEETARQLNYPAFLNFAGSTTLFERLHRARWGQEITLLSNFIFIKKMEKLQVTALGLEKFDLIYFDAFAPSKQGEMWELPILQKVTDSMKVGAVFVTYCAQGQFKRHLKSLGLEVQTLPGSPGKKEMVRALKS